MVSASTRPLPGLGNTASVAWPPLDPPAAGLTRPTAAPPGPVPHPGPQRRHLMQWLQDSLSTELVCVLRSRAALARDPGRAAADAASDAPAHIPHHGALGIAPFMAHPNGLLDVDPPGRPERQRELLTDGAAASHDEAANLKATLRDTLVAERVAVETYRHVIELIGDRDDSTRRMVEALLADELEHVAHLEAWLARD